MNIKKLVSAFALAATMLSAGTTAEAQTPRPEYPRPQFERIPQRPQRHRNREECRQRAQRDEPAEHPAFA